MVFSRQKINPVKISIMGQDISWVQSVKHLGNYISLDLLENKEIQIKKGDLIRRVNCMMAYLGDAPRPVRTTLFQSDCCHFYGCSAWCIGALMIQL